MSQATPNVKDIFDRAREIDSQVERESYLTATCIGSPEIRSEVDALLRAFTDAGSFLEKPAVSPSDLPSMEPCGFSRTAAEIGTMIAGRYKLLEVIGEGAMGTVFKAEQTQPVKRTVALKVIKAGMDSRRLLARFEAERQALALMEHPNIAKVLDSGSTESGYPFFVMERVEGVPLTRFCDANNLSVGDRLQIFQQICHAVQHAHQKGIIHRDLKPSNIMVETHEGRPLAKVIDFGLAKALNALTLTDRTLFTFIGMGVGTPMYMAPEQAESGAQDVDTRADIYSLGVILYELLTGTTPLEKKRLAQVAWDEVRRVIREEIPQTPSARLSTTEASASIAAQRRSEPMKLCKFIRGELDWIVMMALRKERDRRYESAMAFSQDIERFLKHEPVRACPPSALYRFRKLAQRNKAGLTVTGLVALSLVVAVVVLLASNFRIAHEKKQKEEALQKATENEARAITEAGRAKAVANLVQQMLAAAKPEAARGAYFTVRELLDEFAMGLGEQLRNHPEAEVDIRGIIGRAYRQLGMNQQAETHLKRALELRRANPASEPKQLAQSLVDWAWAIAELGEHEHAEAALREALALYQDTDSEPRQRLEALRVLQRVAISRSREVEVVSIEQEARRIAASLPGQNDPEFAGILFDHARFQLRLGRVVEAECLAQESVEMNRQTRAKDHPEVAWSLLELGRAQAKQGKFDEAETQFRKAREIFLKHFGNSNSIALRMGAEELAAVLRAQNQVKDADDVIRDFGHRLLSGDTRRDFAAWLRWAETLRAADQWEEALAIYMAAAKLRTNASRASRLQLARGLKVVVSSLQVLQRYKECLPVHRECARIFEEILAEAPEASDVSYVKLEASQHLAEFFAGVLVELGHRDEAIRVYRRAIGLLREVRTAITDWGEYARCEGWYCMMLAERLYSEERPNEAIEFAVAGMRIYQELVSRNPTRTDFTDRLGSAEYLLIRILQAAKPSEKIISHFRELAKCSKQSNGADSHCHICAMRHLGLCLLKLQKWSDAEPVIREYHTIDVKSYPASWTAFHGMSMLGIALLEQGKHNEAESWLKNGYEGMKKLSSQIPADGFEYKTEALARLVQLYDAWGKPAEAAKWRAEFPPIEKGPRPREVK